MSPNTDREDATAPDAGKAVGFVPGRRRLLRGGLGAAPVIMTFVSAPVTAGTCTTCSAYGSMHPSGRHASSTCGGHSPSVWYSTPHSHWPINPNSLFSTYFSPALSGTSVTLKNVLDPTKGYSPLAQNCVAALLNASTSPPLTPPNILGVGYVKGIWSSYANQGYFQPTAGIQWNAGQIVNWITTTYS